MKSCKKYCVFSIILGLLIGSAMCCLSFFGLICIPSCSGFFPLLILLGAATLLSLLLAFLLSEHFKQLQEAYYCGGKTALTGAVFLILSALFASLWHWYWGICFSVILGVCFFFLTFILVGLWGILHTYFRQRPTPPGPPLPKPEPPRPCPPHNPSCGCKLMEEEPE